MMKILVVDNYDSFTYNLVYLLKQNKKVKKLTILRNDKINGEPIGDYDKILLSPGPGIPSEAGSMPAILKEYSFKKAILGVCLGHQGMGEAFGCTIENMDQVLHGFQDEIAIDTSDYLFKGLPKKITIGRYHSWRIKKDSLKLPLEIISTDHEGEVMAIRHSTYDLRGVQFHPESVMSQTGQRIINNWINQ